MVTVSTDTSQNESQYASRSRCVHTVTDRFSVSNAYLIQENRLIVVDPVSDIQVQLLARYIQTFLHRSPADIDMIILTNLQQDHTNGLQALRRICSAPVAASSAAFALTQEESHMPLQRAGRLAGVYYSAESFTPLYIHQLQYATMWLQDVGGIPFHSDWRVIASPGRSLESLCLFNPFTKELLSGNTILTTEGHTPVLRRGGNRSQLHETLRVLRSLPIRYLYPAHGPQMIGFTPLNYVQVEW
jgi:glyoxylase-like metal-dependent hydrolase (beta-lactamase superfamily II)